MRYRDNESDGIQTNQKMVTPTLIWTVLAVAIGSGFQHGYNSGVLNAPQKVIESWMNETERVSDNELTVVWGVTTSIMCMGGIIGGASTGVLSTGLGRRMALILNNSTAVIAGILMGSSKYLNQPWALILGRFIIGINAGINNGVAPMFLSEISPTRLRGTIGTIYQLSMTTSVLIAQIASIDKVLGTEKLWPFLLLLVILPAVYQSLALLVSPESPKYLLEIGEEQKALSASIKLCGKKEGTQSFEKMKHEVAQAKSQPTVTMKDLLYLPKYRRPLILMCLLMVSQQLSGINAVFYYSTQIFDTINLSDENAQLATIGVGLVNVLSTIVAVFLMDLLGRKPLLMIGFGGMTVTLTVLLLSLYLLDRYTVMAYAAVIVIYLYIIVFAVGPGPVPWIMGSELFATAARPLGVSVAISVNWLSNFFVGLSFLPIQSAAGPSVFIIFIVCMALATIFTLIKIPETKNRPIHEITSLFE